MMNGSVGLGVVRSKKLRWLLSVERASRLLQRGSISVLDLVHYCYNRGQWADEEWKLNVMDHWMDIEKIKEACEVSQGYLDQNKPRSILEGIPMTLKANMAHSQLPLTASSNILSTGIESGYDCDVGHQLWNAGGICLGTTTMDEFGMGSLGTNSNTGPTKNPIPYLSSHQSNTNSEEEEENDEVWVQRILHSSLPVVNGGTSVEQDWVVGGSSCGAAASVALGSSLVAMGTDTGGSVRLPAAWCSIVGFKPTYGTYSRHGIVSYASSLDTVGILTPTVQCASHVHHTLTSVHHTLTKNRDPTTYIPPTPTKTNSSHSKTFYYSTPKTNKTNNNNNENEKQDKEEKCITIGMPSAFSIEECPMYVRQAWDQAAQQLLFRNNNNNIDQKKVQIVTIENDRLSLDLIQQSLAAYYVLACAEASSNLSRYDGLRYGPPHTTREEEQDTSDQDSSSLLEKQYSQYRKQHFGEEVIRRLLCGTSVLSSDRFHTHYEAATKIRSLLSQQFHQLFASGHVDAILIPTTIQCPPPPLQQSANKDATTAMANDIMTVPISLAGLPTLSIPIYPNTKTNNTNNDISVGIQIVGDKFSEALILRIAHSLQSNLQLQ